MLIPPGGSRASYPYTQLLEWLVLHAAGSRGPCAEHTWHQQGIRRRRGSAGESVAQDVRRKPRREGEGGVKGAGIGAPPPPAALPDRRPVLRLDFEARRI